jgi:outer membrane lipoprotein-sorting protein
VLKLLLLIVLAIPLVAMAACHQEGPAERAGTSVDNAAQKVKDAVDPPGPAQKAGRALDKTTE